MSQGTIHLQRINRVINFVHAACGEEIGLDAMADVACLSKFHFVRVFRQSTGETPVSYLKRLRLERAACKLVYLRDVAINEIAFDCGFASAQSFSRAFLQSFGMSPRQFREHNVYRFQAYWQDRETTEPCCVRGKCIEIRERPDRRAAYVRLLGAYGETRKIAQTFEDLRGWAAGRGVSLEGSALFGIPWDDPNVTPPEKCRYDVCLEIPDDLAVERQVSTQRFSGGAYATLKLDDAGLNLRHAWEVFKRAWLPKSGCSVDFRAACEIFEPATPGGSFVCAELWLPVKQGPEAFSVVTTH